MNYAKRRVATLIGVHLLIAGHIAHWLVAGRTLAPLDLNEVLHTVHLGVITAGTIFMTLVVLSVLIFGRFFCSWACHVVALQDLCAWMLKKLHIKPKQVRSRVLLFVPLGVMLYLFVWPQVTRLWHGHAAPKFVTLTDAQGWGSFVTDDFWRNLPGAEVTMATFLICGFAIVYVLGSRGFCTYGCPWGALFNIVDRVAPGRILAKADDCTQCGKCTSVCDSRVRVHDEVREYGRIVSPACLKDLDCVSACPNGVLSFGYARPHPIAHKRAKPTRYDFTVAEDAALGAGVLVFFVIFRGLYDAIPLLLALGMAMMTAYLAVVGAKLVRGRRVRLGHLRLNRHGSLTRAGRVTAAMLVLVAGLVAHSAVIRYHEYAGQRAFDRIGHGTATESTDDQATALHHFQRVQSWGLLTSTALHRRLASLHHVAGDTAETRSQLAVVLAREPGDLKARHLLASLDPPGSTRAPRAAREKLSDGVALVRQGRTKDAVDRFRAAIALDPRSVVAHNNLGVLLHKLGRSAEAVQVLEASIALDPASPRTRINLGGALMRLGRHTEAEAAFDGALRLDPGNARAQRGLIRAQTPTKPSH